MDVLVPNEELRLAEVKLLSGLPLQMKTVDGVVELAATVCRAPFAFVAFVDAETHKVAARFTTHRRSFDDPACSGATSFCRQTIAARDVLVVPDASDDARFAAHPWVVGRRPVRFYAGAPVVTPRGNAVGTLSVFDRRPRDLSPWQRQALRTLAGYIAVTLESERVLANLAEDSWGRVLDELSVVGGQLATVVASLTGLHQRAPRPTSARTLLESLPLAVWTLDADDRVLEWNAAAELLLGWTRGEVVGSPLPAELVPEDVPDEHELVRRVRAGWPLTDFTTRRRRRDGRLVDVTLHGASCGSSGGVVMVAIDATERRRLERDRARIEELEETLRLREELVMVACHDLRTPLMTIQVRLHTLTERARRYESEHPGPPYLRGDLALLERQVARIGSVMNRLLDVTRMEAGAVDLTLEECDLVTVVNDIVGVHREATGGAILVKAPATIVGRWDRLRLEQIVTNLVSNAVRYGAGRPVEVRLSCHDERAILEVEDHGIGIPLEQQARMFERFERMDAGGRSGGFGLGLWIVRQIVEALGGTVGVASAPGYGSTFTVALPVGGPRARRSPREDSAGRSPPPP